MAFKEALDYDIALNSIAGRVTFSFTGAVPPHMVGLCPLSDSFPFRPFTQFTTATCTSAWKASQVLRIGFFPSDFASIFPSVRAPFPTALSKPPPLGNLGDHVVRQASPMAPPTWLVSITQLLPQLVFNPMMRAKSEGTTYMFIDLSSIHYHV